MAGAPRRRPSQSVTLETRHNEPHLFLFCNSRTWQKCYHCRLEIWSVNMMMTNFLVKKIEHIFLVLFLCIFSLPYISFYPPSEITSASSNQPTPPPTNEDLDPMTLPDIHKTGTEAVKTFKNGVHNVIIKLLSIHSRGGQFYRESHQSCEFDIPCPLHEHRYS